MSRNVNRSGRLHHHPHHIRRPTGPSALHGSRTSTARASSITSTSISTPSICPERQPLGQAPARRSTSPPSGDQKVPNVNCSITRRVEPTPYRWSLAPNVNRSGKHHHLSRRPVGPERQPFGQAPSLLSWSRTAEASPRPERQPFGQAPSECVLALRPVRLGWLRRDELVHRVPNVNRSGKLHHVESQSVDGRLRLSRTSTARARSVTGSLQHRSRVPNVNRSGQLHHRAPARRTVQSRTSTARASFITRDLAAHQRLAGPHPGAP